MIYRPTITGGPAGDVGLGAFAKVLRAIYADGRFYVRGTDDDALELFAAFLAGHERPPAIPTRPT